MKKKIRKICCIFTIVVLVCNIMSLNIFSYGDDEFVPRPDGYCLDDIIYDENSNYGISLYADSSQMSISDEGVDFIIAREGFHSTCYVDGDHMSIGYGTSCGSGIHQAGLHSITREQARTAMMSHINNRSSPTVRRYTEGLNINQSQFDALVSLAYNTGGGSNSVSGSPLVRYLKGELAESQARDEYSRWWIKSSGVVLQGLINRRNAEADLFFKYCPPSPEISITEADASGTIYYGDNFNISGIISSGLPLTSAKLNFIDGVGNTVWSYEMNPNGSTNFSIANSIQHLPVGVHKFTVTASNSERTNVTLYEKTFAVLSHEKTLDNGTYKISYSSNSTYLMGAAGFNSGDNVNLYIDASQSGKPGNVWYIKNEGNGYYIIRNFGTGYYLDVANGSSQDGTNVSQWELNRGDGQLWQILPAGGGTYCLVPKCATESGADVNSGNNSNIEIYGLHLGVNQRFVFTQTDSSFTSGNKITFNTNGGTIPSSFASRTVNGVNKNIDTGELIIYNTPGQTARLPDANYVMAVVGDNGQVKHYSKYVSGDEDIIPSNGFAIVGHRSGGDDGASFLEQIQLFDYLGYDSSTKTVYAYKTSSSYLANHKYVENGSMYGELPTPIRSGYDFDGWYTAASGGTKVTSNSYYSTSKLYAHWKTASGVVPINSTTFPDENFRACVEVIDSDKSGWLSEDEINGKWTMSIANKGIKDLTGIEYFTSLQYLYCQQNELTSLDLSKNKALSILSCSNNKLVSLDLSNNTNLKVVNCFKNNLINVNINNTQVAVTSFFCTTNSQGTAGTENNYNIGTVKNSYSLSNLTKYGFVSSKASNWKGATYNASTNSLTNFTSTKISYDYDCGNGLTATFYLTADSIPNSNNGDLNNDGKVDLKDLAFMKSILAKDDTSQYTGSADLNGDGKVNLRDLAALKYLLASN